MVKTRGRRILMLLENNSYQSDIRPKREAKTLIEAGYQVSVICPRPPNGKMFEIVDGVHLYQFPIPQIAGGFWYYIFEYTYATSIMFLLSIFVLLTEGFDILHAHNPPDTFFPIAAFYKLLGKRFVFDHHDLAPEMYYFARFQGNSNRLLYDILALFEKLSCRLANCVLATNESYKAVEMERGKVPEERVFIVRNGPDPESLQPIEPDPDLRRRAKTLIGYVGRMGPQDGVDYLLKAIHCLAHNLERRDVLCIIIGKGDVLPQLKALAKELKIEEHIWFTGWIPDEDLIRILSTVDICVDPDPSNPFTDRSTMIKMMEYMSLGKPIVAFDLPEHRVTGGNGAVYSFPNDEYDFARQIALLMDDPGKRQRMGQCGRYRIETELAWCYQEKVLLEAYKTLTNHR